MPRVAGSLQLYGAKLVEAIGRVHLQAIRENNFKLITYLEEERKRWLNILETNFADFPTPKLTANGLKEVRNSNPYIMAKHQYNKVLDAVDGDPSINEHWQNFIATFTKFPDKTKIQFGLDMKCEEELWYKQTKEREGW